MLSPQAGSLTDLDDKWLNNKVLVIGTVRRFVAADIEREVGFDVARRIESEHRDRAVIVLTSFHVFLRFRPGSMR